MLVYSSYKGDSDGNVLVNQLLKLIGTMSGNEEFRYAGDANWYRFSEVSISVAIFRCLGVSPAI
jgi:hypothetical protein